MTSPLQPGDALVVVDVQEDFVTGSLAVPGAPRILPAVRRAVAAFRARGLPVIATRDWHPADHVSFAARGGPWPPHCVADSPGAAFAAGLELPPDAHVVSKATTADRDAYSGFEGTELEALLRRLGARRLFVCGLATDYCVLATVRDARRAGFEAILLADAVAAVNVNPDDGEAALRAMREAGARAVRVDEIEG